MKKQFDVYEPRPYPDTIFLGWKPDGMDREYQYQSHSKPFIRYPEPRIINLKQI